MASNEPIYRHRSVQYLIDSQFTANKWRNKEGKEKEKQNKYTSKLKKKRKEEQRVGSDIEKEANKI